MIIDRHEKKAAPQHRGEHDAQQVEGPQIDRDPHHQRDQHDHDHLRQGADAGGERLAGDQRRAGARGHHEFAQDAGVPVPDDLDAVEDRDEQRRLGDDARRQERQIGHPARRDRPQLAEGLP